MNVWERMLAGLLLGLVAVAFGALAIAAVWVSVKQFGHPFWGFGALVIFMCVLLAVIDPDRKLRGSDEQ